MFSEVPPEVYYSQRAKDLESRLAAAEKRLKWAEDLLNKAKDIIHQGHAGGPKWLEDYEKGPVE